MKSHESKTRSLINKLVIGTAVLAIAAGLIYFVAYLVYASGHEDTNDAQVESYIIPVSARASGFIKNVRFEEYQLVRQGDTLVILDDREYVQKVKEAEALLEDTRAQQQILEASIKSAQSAALMNKDQINSAQAVLKQQEQDLKRLTHLYRDNAATLSDFEKAQTQYDVSKSNYSAAVNGLKTSDSRIAELKAKYNSLFAAQKRGEALLDLARLQLSYTVITSPYNGHTGRKKILDGQQVQLGQPLVSIVSTDLKWVTANFKETQIHGMYVGQPVAIKADADPSKTYLGKIDAISETTGSKFSLLPTDNSVGNFVKVIQRVPVRILFNDSDVKGLKAGMNVKVVVDKSK
jgi:membrane fusion protein (multidrug efflux system)